MGAARWPFGLISGLVWLSVSVTRCSWADQTVETINAARCAVRCLSQLQSRVTSVAGSSEPVSLRRCQLDAVCSECWRPCSQPFVSVKECEDWCSSQHAKIVGRSESVPASSSSSSSSSSDCAESCRFLRQVNTIRPGTCPPETQATGFAALCINSCDNDADCDPSLKCCSNACGWTCQTPTHVHDGMPDVPSAPTISNVPSSTDAVLLNWLPLGSNITGTVLYLVDARSSVGRQTPTDHAKSHWQQMAQTTSTSTRLEGLRPGHWYQFRLSAVNIYGSRGPSSPTQPFTLSKDPEKPGPPTNLTEGDSLITENKVAVTIHWSPPSVSDLPISRYKMYWSKRIRGVSPQFQSMQEYRQVLSGDRHAYRLMDLDPDTTYFVQVQAIAQHGEVRLKSDRASLYITTYPLPRSSSRVFLSTSAPNVTVRPMPTPPVPDQLTVVETYYQNGLLKANLSWSFEEAGGRDERPDKLLVYWSTEGCSSDLTLEEPPVMSATTHTNYFTIYDLRFNCRYLIRVQSVTVHGVTGSMAYSFLDTPHCGQALVIGEVQPDCPRTGVRLPSEPTNVQYKFIVSSSNISVRLSWDHPSSIALPLVTGYRVSWGLVLTASQHLLLDKSNADQRDVPKDVQVLVLTGLQESSTYAVCVQAMSRAGRGRVMSLRFTTPALQPVPVDPPYVDIGRGRGDTVRQNSVKKKPPHSMTSDLATSYPPPIVWTFQDHTPVKHVLNASPPTSVSSSSSTLLSSATDIFLLSCLCFSLRKLPVS